MGIIKNVNLSTHVDLGKNETTGELDNDQQMLAEIQLQDKRLDEYRVGDINATCVMNLGVGLNLETLGIMSSVGIRPGVNFAVDEHFVLTALSGPTMHFVPNAMNDSYWESSVRGNFLLKDSSDIFLFSEVGFGINIERLEPVNPTFATGYGFQF